MPPLFQSLPCMPYFYINQLLKRIAYTLSQIHSSIDPTTQLDLFVSRLPETSNIPKSTPSVQFSHSVMSDSLRPHGLQHTRPPYPSPTPRVYSDSFPLMMPSNHLILCCPLLLPPSIFPSIRVFSNESALCIRWPKY